MLKRLILSNLLLIIGLLIYLIWRPEGIFGGYFTSISVKIQTLELPDWLIGSLPDAMWYASLLCYQSNIFDRHNGKWNIFISVVALGLPFIHEVSQKMKIFPGTFDMIDLIFYLIVASIYLIICIISTIKKTRK